MQDAPGREIRRANDAAALQKIKRRQSPDNISKTADLSGRYHGEKGLSMTDHLLTIDRSSILSLTSASPDKIVLHYANTGDILYHASAMLSEYAGSIGSYPDTPAGDRQLSEDVVAMLDHSMINAYLMIQVSRTQPRIGLVIDVETPDGQRLHRKHLRA